MRVYINLKNKDYCDDCPLLDFGTVCKLLNIAPEKIFGQAKELGQGLHLIRPEKCKERHG